MRRHEATVARSDFQALADVGHVHLRVCDLDRSLDFYTRTLGMRVVLRQPKHAFLAFGDYHHHVALDARGDYAPRPDDADRRAGLHHFAIRFPDEQSLAAVVARIQAAGGELRGADFTVTRGVFTTDPDGNGIELSCDRARQSWPADWASVDGLGRWRPLDPGVFAESPSAASRFLEAPAGAGEAYWTIGMRMVVIVPSGATGGRFEICEFECPPGFATPLHVHSREDETFRVLEGEIRFVCGEVTGGVEAGGTVHLPRGVAQAFATLGDRPARLLHTASPGGMAGFHMAVGVPANGPAPDPALIDRDAVARAAADYGIVTLSPPPDSLFSHGASGN